jgi:hypothetical protein
MHFKKHGARDNGKSSANRGIEALQVSDLADAAQVVRQANKFVGFRERSGQRLFDQHIDACLHQLLRGLEVVNSGHGDRGSLHFAMGYGELLDRTKAAAAEFAGHRVSPHGIRIDHADQPYGHPLSGKLLINPSVVAAKRAHANHGYVNEVVRAQFRFSIGRLPHDLLI